MNNIIEELKRDLLSIKKLHDFRLIRSKYVKGISSNLMQSIKDIPITVRPEKAKEIQLLVKEIETIIKLAELDFHTHVEHNEIDIDLPIKTDIGTYHPIYTLIEKIKQIFIYKGFKYFDTPEIETNWRNFESLNIKELHPCRDDHQTFFTKDNRLLRTQTTAFQSYVHEQNKDNNLYKAFTIGRTYRRDSDATHVPMFHQFDCVNVSENTNLIELIRFVKEIFSYIFNKNIKCRFRNSYFPFTSISLEVDILFNDKWLEIGGMGIIDPNVFNIINIQYKKGWALGFGVDRICMILNNIKDIRTLYDGRIYK